MPVSQDSIPVTKTIYYVSTSIDGFIAGAGDSLDWLYEIAPVTRTFLQFASEVGAVAMGAATYECLLRDSGLLEHPGRWQEAHSWPAGVVVHRPGTAEGARGRHHLRQRRRPARAPADGGRRSVAPTS